MAETLDIVPPTDFVNELFSFLYAPPLCLRKAIYARDDKVGTSSFTSASAVKAP